MKILILKSYGIGNAILATPMIRALYNNGHEIHMVTDRGPLGGPVKELLEDLGYLTSIREYRPELSCANEIIKWFKGEQFNLVIQSFPADGLFNWLVPFIGCEFRRCPSVAGGWEKHESEYNLDLVKDLIKECDQKNLLPSLGGEFDLEAIGDKFGIRLVSLNTIFVGICPSYKREGLWWKKNWGEAKFAALIDLLPNTCQAVLVGGPEDVDSCNKIVALTNRRCYNMAGLTTIKETMGILYAMDFVVGNDCGPLHIANALGVPTFAIFGPTSITKNKPNGNDSYVLVADLPCVSCQGAELWNKCLTPYCLQAITPQAVMNSINKYIFEDEKGDTDAHDVGQKCGEHYPSSGDVKVS